MSDRFFFPRAELRQRTVRGAAINAAFLVLVDGLVLVQGLIVTRLLGPSDIGLYGIVTITVMSLLALKRVGIDEAYVQQQEAGQEEEFQRAFTLELGLSAGFALAVCVIAPILAATYGESELLGLTLATAYLPLAFALQAPGWVFFRRMDFVRQRALQAIVPVVTFAVTVPLAATGFGVWSLVVGPAAGNLLGALAALAVSPYRVRLRFDRDVARRYLAFSVPVFVAALAALVVAQGQVLAFDAHLGLAGAGYITLALTLTRYIDRADQIVATTIYPAICAVQGRTAALTELFVKSNRATMMWTLPFAAGIVLFAPDLVDFVLGERWEPAVGLLQGLAIAGALQQVGFNWFSFYRAHGETRPTAVEASVGALAFLALAVPALFAWGTTGFVIGRVAGVLIALGVRARFVARMLPAVSLPALAARSVTPVAAGAAAVLALRGVAWGGTRPAAQAVAEIALFLGVLALVTLRLERDLLAEIRGGLRSESGLALARAEQQPG